MNKDELKTILNDATILSFTYEFTDNITGLYDGNFWVAKTWKVDTMTSYDGEFEYNELITELNTKWAGKHIIIKDALLTPPYHNNNLTVESGEMVEFEVYDSKTFEAITKKVDKAQCSKGILIRFADCSKSIDFNISYDEMKQLYEDDESMTVLGGLSDAENNPLLESPLLKNPLWNLDESLKEFDKKDLDIGMVMKMEVDKDKSDDDGISLELKGYLVTKKDGKFVFAKN